MSGAACEFFYDFSSPYSYLAAMRVDELMPVRPTWRPIAFGVIVQRVGKVPWSFADDRREDFAEIERRADQRGLPPVRYPSGWPRESYSLAPLRAAVLAEDAGLLREVSRELFRAIFVDGKDLAQLDAVLDAAERAGMEREQVRLGIQRQETKDRLQAATDEALGRGITGVPTIALGDTHFWGDDQLEPAAAAIAAI
jgi:2-hydroxychromene-2-carboxylate isomerase